MARPIAIASAAALLALSILAGCGFGDSTTTVVTPTMTVPSPPDSTTPPDPSGTTIFSGETEQGLPFVFVATPSSVVQLRFEWRAPCADGKVRSIAIGLGAATVDAGSFSFDSTLQTGGETQVEGAIHGDRASGTFSRSKGTSFGIDCAVSGVHWDARAGAASSAGQGSSA